MARKPHSKTGRRVRRKVQAPDTKHSVRNSVAEPSSPQSPQETLAASAVSLDQNSIAKQLTAILASKKAYTASDYLEMSRLSALRDECRAPLKDRWNEQDTAEVTAMLTEYQSLRQESLATIRSRWNIIILGIGAIGALFAGSLSIDSPTERVALVIALFSIAIPVLSLLILVLWVGEGMRMKRVSDYIASDLETRINRKLGTLAVSWDGYLKSGVLVSDGVLGPSMYVFIIVTLLSLASPIVGVRLAGISICWTGGDPHPWYISVPWVSTILTVIFLVMHVLRLQNKGFKGEFKQTTYMKKRFSPDDLNQISGESLNKMKKSDLIMLTLRLRDFGIELYERLNQGCDNQWNEK